MLALSTILAEFAVVKFAFGGSVTIFSQVPIILISYRYGCKWGAVTGISMAMLQLLFGLNNFSYVSGFFAYAVLFLADYFIAFTALGFGGMFRKKIKNQALALAVGSTVVTLVRYLCHFVSGVTIWKSFAGDMPVWKYSLIYNGGYMLPELIITVIGVIVVANIFDLSSPELEIKHKKRAAAE